MLPTALKDPNPQPHTPPMQVIPGGNDRGRARPTPRYPRTPEAPKRSASGAGELLAKSHNDRIREIVALSKRAALSDAPVLITGETGTGKQVLARAIHGWSDRRDEPLLEVNCAALPEGVLESELFGQMKRLGLGGARDHQPA